MRADVGYWDKEVFLWKLFLWLLFSRSVVSNSFATPWTVARQVPLSMGFPRQGILQWVAVSCSRDLPDKGIGSTSAAFAGEVFTPEPPSLLWKMLIKAWVQIRRNIKTCKWKMLGVNISFQHVSSSVFLGVLLISPLLLNQTWVQLPAVLMVKPIHWQQAVTKESAGLLQAK